MFPEEAKQSSALEELGRFFLLSLDMLCSAGFDGYFNRQNQYTYLSMVLIWES